MQIDLRQRTAAFRILYAGPERATKFLNLRRLQEGYAQKGEPLRVMHTIGGRVLCLEWSETTEDWPGYTLRTTVSTVPGQSASPAMDELLVAAADAIVFLPARDDPGGQATTEAFQALRSRLERLAKTRAVPVIIQDYADATAPLDDALVRTLPASCAVQRVAVRGDVQEGVGEVFGLLRQRLLTEARCSSARASESVRKEIDGARGAARRELPANLLDAVLPERRASTAPDRMPTAPATFSESTALTWWIAVVGVTAAALLAAIGFLQQL